MCPSAFNSVDQVTFKQFTTKSDRTEMEQIQFLMGNFYQSNFKHTVPFAFSKT